MSFVTWYSIRQSLPDARVAVSCVRGQFEMLKWCPRQRVPYFFHSDSCDPLAVALGRTYVDRPVLILDPLLTVHEPLPGDLSEALVEHGAISDVSPWCLAAKEEDLQVFSSIGEGCGSFRLSRWIDSGGNPLGYAERFLKGSLTASERKVLNLWYKAAPLYDNIG
jgi:hypothetical protein